MEQLQKAKAAAEGWLTRVSKKMESLLVRDPPPTRSELVEALEEFDKRLARLEEVQTQIELEIDPDQLESYLDQADATRQKARKTRLLGYVPIDLKKFQHLIRTRILQILKLPQFKQNFPN